MGEISTEDKISKAIVTWNISRKNISVAADDDNETKKTADV